MSLPYSTSLLQNSAQRFCTRVSTLHAVIAIIPEERDLPTFDCTLSADIWRDLPRRLIPTHAHLSLPLITEELLQELRQCETYIPNKGPEKRQKMSGTGAS